MVGMARTWALELAGDGITVNVVAPGPIADTEMFRSIVPEGSEREKALAAAIPVKRLGQSDDVARAVMFFYDPANGFVTGLSVPKTKFVNNGGEGHRRPRRCDAALNLLRRSRSAKASLGQWACRGSPWPVIGG